MGRTIRDYVFTSPPPKILAETIHNYLIAQGYKFKQRGAEGIYQKGAGLMMGPTFLKFTIMGNGARIEGWQEYAVLPGVYAGEMDIDSFIGIATKGPLKERFRYMESLIIQYGGTPAFPGGGYAPISNMAPPQMPQGGYPPVQGGYQQIPAGQQPYAQPVPAQTQAGRFCPKCGAPADGIKFCMKCGNKLE